MPNRIITPEEWAEGIIRQIEEFCADKTYIHAGEYALAVMRALAGQDQPDDVPEFVRNGVRAEVSGYCWRCCKEIQGEGIKDSIHERQFMFCSDHCWQGWRRDFGQPKVLETGTISSTAGQEQGTTYRNL